MKKDIKTKYTIAESSNGQRFLHYIDKDGIDRNKYLNRELILQTNFVKLKIQKL